MPDIDPIDDIPAVTPRQALQPGNKRSMTTDAINKARWAVEGKPMRFDAGGAETPLSERPRLEDMPIPPTGGMGGILKYAAGPFIKHGAEAAKKYAEGWRIRFGTSPQSEANIKSILDDTYFAQAGDGASKAARAAMKEAGEPTRYDLSRVKLQFEAAKPYKTETNTITEFPVRVPMEGHRDPVKIGAFRRIHPGGEAGTVWRFRPEQNMLVEPKRDNPVLHKAFKEWLRTNKMGGLADEFHVSDVQVW